MSVSAVQVSSGSSWSTKQLKWVLRLAYGDALPAESRAEGDVWVYGSNGVVGHHDRRNTAAPALIIGRKGSFGKVTYADRGGFCIDTAFFADAHTSNCDLRWAYWVLQTLRLDEVSEDTGVPGLSREHAHSMVVQVPSLAVQSAIAGFLDCETARIDALIEKKTRFIELLREKRQALITQAVTRGFDSATPLEASAVEWLPPIPAHWSVTRLRFVIKAFEQGWSPECYAYPAGAGEWGVVKAGCVNRGVFDPEQNKRLPEEHVPREDIEIRPGDVLMSRASGSVELIGSVALATATDARLMLSDKTFRLALQPEWDADFFVYTMKSSAVRDQILAAISGAEGLANNLAQASIKEFIVVQPPRSEQEQIAADTTARLSRLDKIAALTESSLHLLRERRAALITATVTGQIDVRAEAMEEAAEPA